jgi:hypothetical protein
MMLRKRIRFKFVIRAHLLISRIGEGHLENTRGEELIRN